MSTNMHTERIVSTKPRAERYRRQPGQAPTDHGRDGCGRGGKVVPVDDVALPATAVQGGLWRLSQSAWPVGVEVETARGVMPRGSSSNSTKLRFSRKFPPHSRHHSPAYPVPFLPTDGGCSTLSQSREKLFTRPSRVHHLSSSYRNKVQLTVREERESTSSHWRGKVVPFFQAL